MPVSASNAPNISNYQIPTGKVYFTDDTTTSPARVDLGNCVEFSITNAVTTKDHTRTYGGSRIVDDTIVTLVAGTVTFTLDEITKDGLGMFAQGLVSDNTGGAGWDVMALTRTTYRGVLEIIGDNSVGPQIDWIGYCNISPTGAMFFIRNNDDWNTIPLEGKILAHATHGLGHYTLRALHEGLTA
jgi:hypothetical protein